MKREVRVGGKPVRLDFQLKGDRVEFAVEGGPRRSASILETEKGIFSVLLDGASYQVFLTRTATLTTALVRGREVDIEIFDPRAHNQPAGPASNENKQVLKAPMPGKIVRRLVREGERVHAGQGLIIVEAMKMQNEMRSIRPGTVTSIHVEEGATVAAGEMLAVIESE